MRKIFNNGRLCKVNKYPNFLFLFYLCFRTIRIKLKTEKFVSELYEKSKE